MEPAPFPAEWARHVQREWRAGELPADVFAYIGPNFVVADRPILISDPGVKVFRAWASMAHRPEWPCFELFRASDTIHPKLVLAFKEITAARFEAMKKECVTRLRRCFAENTQLTQGVTVRFMFNAVRHRAILVCDKLCCSNPKLLAAMGQWILKDCEDPSLNFSDQEQFSHKYGDLHPVANTGEWLPIAPAFTLDDAIEVPLAMEVDDFAQSWSCMFSGSRSSVKLVTPNSNARTFSAEFSTYWRRIGQEAVRGSVGDVNDATRDYIRSLQSSRSGCVDLSDQALFFAVENFGSGLTDDLVAALKEDEGHYVFQAARALLDRIFARQGSTLVVKVRDSEGNVILSEQKGEATAYFKAKGLFWEIPYPSSGPIETILRKVIPGGNNTKKLPACFDFFVWYWCFGIGHIAGTCFRPLGYKEPQLLVSGYVNQFRGLGVFNLLRRFENERYFQYDRYWEERVRLTSLNEDLAGANTPFQNYSILMRQVCYMLGEEPAKVLPKILENGAIESTASGQFFAFLANMLFDPVHKKPRYYILQSPPGCGKSTFFNAIGKKLMHRLHFMAYIDLKRLTEHFNGHAELNIFSLLEEAKITDLGPSGLRMLQEIISCSERYQRRLYMEGSMVQDYRFFVFLTNIDKPVPLPPGQRRAVLARFWRPMARRLEDKARLREFTTNLNRAYEDDEAWIYFSVFLYKMYFEDKQRVEEWKRAAFTTRVFNFDTLDLTFDSLLTEPATSVLGWLWKHLTTYEDLLRNPTEHYVKFQEGTSFLTWKRYNELDSRNHEFRGNWAKPYAGCPTFTSRATDAECKQRRTSTSDWWIRGSREQFYLSYCELVSDLKIRLSLVDFASSVKEILQPNYTANEKEGEQPSPAAFMEDSDIRQPVWCLGPLHALEECFKAAVPNTAELDWDNYRRERLRAKERTTVIRLTRSLPVA